MCGRDVLRLEIIVSVKLFHELVHPLLISHQVGALDGFLLWFLRLALNLLAFRLTLFGLLAFFLKSLFLCLLLGRQKLRRILVQSLNGSSEPRVTEKAAGVAHLTLWERAHLCILVEHVQEKATTLSTNSFLFSQTDSALANSNGVGTSIAFKAPTLLRVVLDTIVTFEALITKVNRLFLSFALIDHIR